MTNLRRAVACCFVAAVACLCFQVAPAGAQGGAGRIDVSIKLQRAYVYAGDGSLLREIPISSGSGGRTPLGHFRVTSKSAWTTATTNSRVSMKWMTRFNGGIGFHGIPRSGSVPLKTPLGVKPVSHGCIRMADADAKWIYDNVGRGTPVNVIPK
jgi:lipoprotein-anchoring transpeptidase ErfK/SrfK